MITTDDIWDRLRPVLNGQMKAEEMAQAVYAVLVDLAVAEGQDHVIEVSIRKPGERRHFAGETSWCVIWEAGPHDWAIPISMAITHRTGKLAEPYYGFDLCFEPADDPDVAPGARSPGRPG
ncbi:MAG TPA: hypothetical protein VGG68_00785 [Caulobacteraceae bacterium]|jgi:hypothetical protein